MKCELASIKIVLKYVKSPICNTKTLLAEVFSTLLETRQFRCKSKYHFLKPLPLHFLINFTTAKYQLLHVFVFPFSSTSRQQSINFFTFSSSHFHQFYDSKVPTSSRFHLPIFINFTTGKASTSSRFHLHFFINFTKAKHQLRHVFIFPFSSTSRKESINFITFSSSHFHQLHDR